MVVSKLGSDTIYDGRRSYTYTPFDIPDSITQTISGGSNPGIYQSGWGFGPDKQRTFELMRRAPIGSSTFAPIGMTWFAGAGHFEFDEEIDANGKWVVKEFRHTIITPSAFSVPLAISQPSSNHTNGTLSIQYGYTGDRVRLTERRPNRPTATPSNQHVNLTTYLLAGSTALFEEDRLGAGNSSEPFRYRYKHSINTPEGTVSIVVIDAPWGGSGSSSMRSDRTFHRDHLGSTVAVTDENGTEFLGYDAWGKRRNANGQDNNNIAAWVGLSSKTDRGYTGHEHIDDIGLIHMNGRLYDPITGRMMSADPIIQAPYLLQNYNRYSYVMNNPLSLTDPSGFSWWTRWRRPLLAIAVAWAIGPAGFWSQTGGIMGNAFASTLAAGFASGGIMGGNIESAVNGAFSAALFYGVGEISGMHTAGVDKSFWSDAHIAQTFGHAVVGCVSTSIAGGSCGSGAASAGFAAAAGPLLPGADISPERFVSRVIVGGISSRLAGDNFANGATSAAFAYLFNELSHARFNRKTGELYVRDADSGKEARGLFFSGTGESDQIPTGDYAILQRGDKDGFRLEPYDSIFGDDKHNGTGQSLLRLHGPGRSNGCVTACDATGWAEVKALVQNTSTSLVTVQRYWSLTLPGGYLLMRIPTGTEQLKYYGRLKVD